MLVCIGLVGCHQAELEQHARALARENEQLRTRVAQRDTDDRSEVRLVHLVWFKLKTDLTDDERTEFMDQIRKLDQIEWVNNLEIGNFAELGDTRAMQEFQLVMGMNFRTEQEYRDYQSHPIHLALKDAVGKYLAGPPVTYDYWTVTE